MLKRQNQPFASPSTEQAKAMSTLDPGSRPCPTAMAPRHAHRCKAEGHRRPRLIAIPTPEGKPRVLLRIRLPDHTITAEVAAKSLRKAQTAIREAGPGSISRVASGPGERHEQRRRA